MYESNGVIKFAPSIKFIVAVYVVEIVLGGLVLVYVISRATP